METPIRSRRGKAAAENGPATPDGAHSVLSPQSPSLAAAQVVTRLRGRYGQMRWRPHGDALTELVLTILSQHTNDTNSGRAFASMQRSYPAWDDVLDAEPQGLIESIRSGGLANQKGPRIQRVLARVREQVGGWDLAFLRDLPLEEAKGWLRALPGVGPKTAACVLMFALGCPALPVDTHVHRVARRLGLIGEAVTADQAHAVLEAIVAPADIYAFHIGLIKHGRHVCTARAPDCGGCMINDLCPSAFQVGAAGSPTNRASPSAGQTPTRLMPRDHDPPTVRSASCAPGSRGMGKYITILKRAFGSFGTDRCATLSAAIAYYTIFSLFPMALVGVSLLGFFVGDASARDRVVDGIASVITLGDAGEQALSDTLKGVNSAKGWIGLIGLATAAWSASGLFGAIRTALDQVWDVDRPLPMLRAKARDLLLFLGFGGLLGASTASTGMLQAARDKGATWLGPLDSVAGPVFGLIVFFAPLLLTFLAFMFLYKTAPHARLSFKDVLPAAVLAALFFEFGKNLLAYYILNMGNANALAGSLGAAILFLAFVYYASQVILFAAEFAKHRLLVVEGTLPATDPKPSKPKVPAGQKVTGTLTRLWSVDESHHDAELPYKPGRMDPVTNRPTNTREEVIMKWQESAEHARQDAGKPAGRPGVDGTRTAPAIHVIAGEARRLGEKLMVESETKVTPVTTSPNARITRNGKEAKLNDIKAGDWVMMTVNHDGTVQKLDATDAVAMRAPVQEAAAAGTDWARVAGFVAPVVLAAFRRKVTGDDDGKSVKNEKERRSRRRLKGPYPMLRRKPSH